MELEFPRQIDNKYKSNSFCMKIFSHLRHLITSEEWRNENSGKKGRTAKCFIVVTVGFRQWVDCSNNGINYTKHITSSKIGRKSTSKTAFILAFSIGIVRRGVAQRYFNTAQHTHTAIVAPVVISTVAAAMAPSPNNTTISTIVDYYDHHRSDT